jgi:hypothetical protein
MRIAATLLLFLSATGCFAQSLQTPFERSAGKQTATYEECISFYRELDRQSGKLSLTATGPTDAGADSLYLVLYATDGNLDPGSWDRERKLVLFINNGIHPGEPDGIDASMMLLRDAVQGTVTVPDNIILAVIPVYNVGGAQNRNSTTRVNQEGPESYGFRGNSQNLDLNRDFTKTDSKEARTFARLFHRLDPNIFVDTHVSDGADYQHTMTLLSTQYDKLGGRLGPYFRDSLDPALYRHMDKAGWPMVPYVNVDEQTPDKGWTGFNDPPRYSSGYAALFQCIAWVPETHMLKPFDQRVRSTYALLQAIIQETSVKAKALITLRKKDRTDLLLQTDFPLSWVPDMTRATMWPFKGYKAAKALSEVTGTERLQYNRQQPFEQQVPVRDHYKPANIVKAPKMYVLPKAWSSVAERLADNGVKFVQFSGGMEFPGTWYHIDSFKTFPQPWEKHYKHYNIHATRHDFPLRVQTGDYIIYTNQPARRFLVEMLEPEGEDSYFAWNFFDGILQRKEGYSDYRWEDVAAEFLREHPEVKAELESRRKADPAFAKDAAAQLRFVYQKSPWFEQAYLRYPVYRVE